MSVDPAKPTTTKAGGKVLSSGKTGSAVAGRQHKGVLPPAVDGFDLPIAAPSDKPPIASLTDVAQAGDVQRGDGIALWRQISEILRLQVDGGTWVRGARVPTELELAAHFKVNRHTVRRAIATLTGDGVLKATQGRGTFVSGGPRLAYTLSERTRYSDIVRAQERAPDRMFLDKTVEEADAKLAALFSVAEGTSLYKFEMRFSADELALSVSTTWLPYERFKRFDEHVRRTNSITKALAEYGVHDYTREATKVSARLADKRERGLLDLPETSVVLVTETLSKDTEGMPIQFAQARFAAERVELDVLHAAPATS